MSVRQALRARRGAVAAAMAVALAFTAAGCGDGGKDNKATVGSSGQSKSTSSGTAQQPGGSPSKGPAVKLAEATGQGGVVLTVNSVTRDSGGFITVSGQFKNSGSENFNHTSAWAGNERDVLASGDSVAGATLVDKVGKKRYYVLRDTGGKCLCTMGISSVDAGQTVPFFAQFPAPPNGTKDVDFQLPTFPTMTVPVSG
uniref:Secreted protein n=1 Tax=Streptomyces sp. NBC_00003 TaxID=2903608 RepID=A0AAU2V4R4_9ACTN